MRLINDTGLRSPADTICFSQMHHEKKILDQQILRELSYEQSISMKSLTHRYDVMSDDPKVYGYIVLLFRYFLEREATFVTASLHPSLTKHFQNKVYSLKRIFFRDQVLPGKSCSKMKGKMKHRLVTLNLKDFYSFLSFFSYYV